MSTVSTNDERECCRVCGAELAAPIFRARFRDVPLDYYECDHCAYVQTQAPSWLHEAYAAAINSSDTGILTRNQANLRLTLATLALLGCRRGRVVDCAGGYGLLVRLLRDAGVNAFWQDPYAENLVSRGFEYQPGGGAADLVTAFEAFEHFVEPAQELGRLLAVAPNLLLTTTLIPRPTPAPQHWWYYGLEHGQHIGFFRLQTLRHLARMHGLHLASDGDSIHLLSRRPVQAWRWHLLRQLARRSLWPLRVGLRSRTWDDHLALAAVGLPTHAGRSDE